MAEWVSVLGGMSVAVAGLGFSWVATRRSEAQSAELTRTNNEHSRAMTELTFAHARDLESIRHEQQAREHRRARSVDAYEEVVETVIRASRRLHDSCDTSSGYRSSGDDTPVGDAEARDSESDYRSPDLTRVLALVTLYGSAEIRQAFDDWYDRFQKLAFAQDRLIRSSGQEQRVWRPQVRDASLHEIDACDRLFTAVTETMAHD